MLSKQSGAVFNYSRDFFFLISKQNFLCSNMCPLLLVQIEHAECTSRFYFQLDCKMILAASAHLP